MLSVEIIRRKRRQTRLLQAEYNFLGGVAMTNAQDGVEEKEAGGLLHAGFELGILLKGLHAAFEIVSGILIWLMNPALIRNIVGLITRNELAEDPKDSIANLLLLASQRYSMDAQHFWLLYLLSHGVVKLVLVFLLWKKKLWAYPLALLVLVFFIAYQTIRWTRTRSIVLIALSLWDLIMIWLTILEYRRLRKA